MGPRIQFWVLTALSGALLALVVTNAVLLSGNVASQREVNARQQVIQQGVQREAIYRELVRDLADLTVARDDVQIRALLQSQGITVKAPQQSAGQVGTAAAPRDNPEGAVNSSSGRTSTKR